MLLYFLLARIRGRVETQALVRIIRGVFAPAIPFAGVVREFRGGDFLAEHKENGRPGWVPAAASLPQIPCPCLWASYGLAAERGRRG